MFNLNKDELKILKSLNTPQKIQSFINKLEINFEKKGETCMSPRKVLEMKKAHCIEGALLAALALRINGYKPLLVDMKTGVDDEEHVIAVFQREGKWGAISKTNHAVLRYREPVYNSIRELVMSYFHEYTDNKGRKTLRSYSLPINLSRFDKNNWATEDKDLWYVHDYLDKVKHFQILDRKQIANLRRADRIELKAGDIVEWKKTKKKAQEN
jgi:hypothetical protein